MAKRSLSMLLAIVTLFSLAVPAFAEEAPAEEPIVTEEPVVEATEVPVETTEEPVVEATEEPAEEPEEVPEAEAPADEPMPVEAAEESVEEPEEPTEDESDSCGNGVTYTLTGDGTLTISGTGTIKNFAFRGQTDIKTVVIEYGVTSIGDYAFDSCDSLTSVTIPDSVTSIGEGAFYYCTALTDVSIPDSVTYISSAAFAGCQSLTSIKLSDSLTSVGLDVFANCKSLTNVTIPAGMTSIRGGMFDDCSGLTDVTISEGVTSVEAYAFRSCSGLTSVTVPASVTSIELGAFLYCTALTSVTVLNKNCDIEAPVDYGMFFGMQYTLHDPKTVVIRGYTGSTAQTYADKYGYKFEALDATPKPTATPTPAPAKLATPKITKMENTASGLKVTWGKVDGAVRYTVFYKLKGASKWTKIGTTTATSYTRKAKDLKSGKTYVFTIRCVKNDKKTYTSDYDKTGKSLTYYAAPTVKISKASNGGIKVTWNKVAGASRYMVYYKENGGSWKRIGTTTATSYTRAASKLKNGKTYQFTVRCVKNDKKTMLSYYKASNSLKYKK